jgi:hypothetical protein
LQHTHEGETTFNTRGAERGGSLARAVTQRHKYVQEGILVCGILIDTLHKAHETSVQAAWTYRVYYSQTHMNVVTYCLLFAGGVVLHLGHDGAKQRSTAKYAYKFLHLCMQDCGGWHAGLLFFA